MAHSIAAVEHGDGAAVLDFADSGGWELDSLADAVVVNGLEARNAMRIDAEPVGRREHVCANGGIVGGHANADESIAHESAQGGEGKADGIVGVGLGVGFRFAVHHVAPGG